MTTRIVYINVTRRKCTNRRRLSGIRRDRTLILVDIENLARDPRPQVATVESIRTVLRRLGLGGSADQVVTACNHGPALTVAAGWPCARHLVRSGPDGADEALLDIALNETHRITITRTEADDIGRRETSRRPSFRGPAAVVWRSVCHQNQPWSRAGSLPDSTAGTANPMIRPTASTAGRILSHTSLTPGTGTVGRRPSAMTADPEVLVRQRNV